MQVEIGVLFCVSGSTEGRGDESSIDIVPELGSSRVVSRGIVTRSFSVAVTGAVQGGEVSSTGPRVPRIAGYRNIPV